MQMSMQNGEKLTPQQINEFLKGSEEINFAGASKAEVYSWVQEVLVAQEFASKSKGDRGVIRAYIEKVTGLVPMRRVRSGLFVRPYLPAVHPKKMITIRESL